MRIFIIILSFILSVSFAIALKNPAAVYCSEMGYEFQILETPQGQMGVCEFPDGFTASSWEFLQGYVGKEFSYCMTNGYEIKTIRDSDICMIYGLDECAVCILADGEEVEVSELMGLDFRETICGDGSCGFPENPETCPNDCNAQIFQQNSPNITINEQTSFDWKLLIYFIVGLLLILAFDKFLLPKMRQKK
ncbi:MAG: DUF333 domain-containing protein [Nanoarchaeota archaeon]|nr:DUF333 domain-containing protein [Nanoarchaeota archaeon]